MHIIWKLKNGKIKAVMHQRNSRHFHYISGSRRKLKLRQQHHVKIYLQINIVIIFQVSFTTRYFH